ncbi:MAG TPA: histidine phosphotransferase family protein, partial [Caulobacteraceae bacterium]
TSGAIASPSPSLTAGDDAVPGQDLATYVAAKLCHDFISPSGAIVQGLDLLKDPSAQDMREDAMGLIEASANKLVHMVHFARVAFGAATTSERFSSEELQTLAQGVFEGVRATLEWDCGVPSLGKPQARALLNLAQIAGGALPTGGVARVSVRAEGGELVIQSISTGPRARLKPEVATGLSGATLTDGLAGQWIQPYWLSRTVVDAGGTLAVETVEERVTLTARMPA